MGSVYCASGKPAIASPHKSKANKASEETVQTMGHNLCFLSAAELLKGPTQRTSRPIIRTRRKSNPVPQCHASHWAPHSKDQGGSSEPEESSTRYHASQGPHTGSIKAVCQNQQDSTQSYGTTASQRIH